MFKFLTKIKIAFCCQSKCVMNEELNPPPKYKSNSIIPISPVSRHI